MSDTAKIHGLGILPDDIEVVIFQWSNKYGHCYECGAPAAYKIGYGPANDSTVEECEAQMRSMTNGERGCSNPDDHTNRVEDLRCSVCAAMAAAEGGEHLIWLFAPDFEDREEATHG